MAAVTICSTFGAQENKVCHCFPIYLPWSDGTGCHDLSFLHVEFLAYTHNKRKQGLKQIIVPPCSVQFSCSIMSESWWPHKLQLARLPCPSLTPGACSNTYPSSQWCHPSISFSVIPFSSRLQSFPASGSFPVSLLHIRWPKYWSFSFNISPSNEDSGLISFRIDWLDCLAKLRDGKRYSMQMESKRKQE